MNPTAKSSLDELSASICWALLRQVGLGRIAMNGPTGEIEVFPVNFVVDHGSVVFTTGAGTKLSLALDGGRATFEADSVDRGTAWSVVAKGPMNVVHLHEELIESFELNVRSWHAGSKPSYVRLVPDIITGRRFEYDTADTLIG
ncbi:pyridoxamine 5'-phosphate oxidase family protein [Ilumatobacter sp.]|uniref:pyridoxamine 5'-phosphate oxidase family protein n=1 Tax=Ilumatobacter sp. TaxID=1967498 RepID=UPI003C521E5A